MYNKLGDFMERKIPGHIAIILDGNGRWAKSKGKIRIEGHTVGYKRIEPVSLYAQSLGVKVLSLYCFSTENWNRPNLEVKFLMNIPVEMEKNIQRYIKNNIIVKVSGRKERIPKVTLNAFEHIVDATKNNTGMILNICFDYGSLYDISEAIKKIKEEDVVVDEQTIFNYLSTGDLPKVDLLIRPGGEKRLSNFLLLESAYAELYFLDTYWPDFSEDDLDKAIDEYNHRNRRYGGIKE